MENQKSIATHPIEAMEVEESPKKEKQNRKLGGMRTMPFIVANEVCDKLAAVGFHANMITYLTQQLNMPLVQASNTLTNFGGTSSFTPMIGALAADCYAGQFWTIIVGSIFYELGLISITISAILPSLHPPPCPTQLNCKEASSSQLWVLYLSLLLTSLGTGGIRPCVMTFAAYQFDTVSKGTQSASGKFNFFNWYYFAMGAATLTALTVIVYIQENVGWGWGLGIPTIAMAVSILAFVAGGPLYRNPKPAGSPLVRLAQVVVAAFKKRKAALPEDPSLLYQNRDLDAAISTDGRLLHSEEFKCLDKAAVLVTEDYQKNNDEKSPPNPWRLSTVHRVEELKAILRMLPIWAAGILHVFASSHQGSFVIQQARSMDRHLFSPNFQIPPASLSIFSIATMLAGLVVYERIFVPFARRYTKNPAGITCLQRMGIGFGINILATVAAVFIEMKRKSAAREHGLMDAPNAVIPISVFWLVPQYVVHGLAEVFMNVGHMEFLYDQSPESMRSTAMALYWITIALGNYMGTFLVTMVHRFSEGKKGGNWIPDRNLNRGRLECYYMLVSGIQVVNLVYYLVVAYFYRYKPLTHQVDEDEKSYSKEEDLERCGENDRCCDRK